MFRIGMGQDSHRFSSDQSRKLVLAGVTVEDEAGLEANSDGDAILHALCNALEQAIGGDSFSVYADPMCQQEITDSREYLKVALAHIEEKNFEIENVGISIEAKRPKILPLGQQLRQSLSQLLQLEKSRIGINATSGEGLTAFGRGEGIQVWATVLLRQKT